MIGDAFFIIKMLIFTMVVVVVLQVKVGDYTLEQRSLVFISQSELIKPVSEVAHGGVVAIKNGFSGFVNLFHSKTSKFFNKENLPGHRSLGLQLKRSQKYIKEKTKEVKNSVENTLGEPIDDFKNRQLEKLNAKRQSFRKKMQMKGLLSSNNAKEDSDQFSEKNSEEMDDELLNELQNEGLEVVE